MIRKPFIKDEHLEYLDELRESGDTNMWGASPFLELKFGMTQAESNDVLIYWMSTFGQEDR